MVRCILSTIYTPDHEKGRLFTIQRMLKAYDTPEIRIWYVKSVSESGPRKGGYKNRDPGGAPDVGRGPGKYRQGPLALFPAPFPIWGPLCSRAGARNLGPPLPAPKRTLNLAERILTKVNGTQCGGETTKAGLAFATGQGGEKTLHSTPAPRATVTQPHLAPQRRYFRGPAGY